MHKQWIKDGLSEYLSDAHAVWHMPGHKRKACYGDFQDAFLAWDVTEVPGTDDLYLPEGFIGDSLAMLKEIYQTCGTYYVVMVRREGFLRQSRHARSRAMRS